MIEEIWSRPMAVLDVSLAEAIRIPPTVWILHTTL
jgi:hypothetical protein